MITDTTGLPSRDAFHRKHTAVFQVEFGGQQQIFVLFTVEADRQRIVLEQVDDGRAVQLHVVQGRTHAQDAALANIEA
ncbi:hypothetical protein D3C84_893470 [compost metagenome]